MKRTAIILTAGALAFGLTACVDTADATTSRVCQHDDTDTVVDDALCVNEVDGYEWEEVDSNGEEADEGGAGISKHKSKIKSKVKSGKRK